MDCRRVGGTRAGSRTRGETHLRVIVVVAGHLDPRVVRRAPARFATASGDARARRAGGSGSRSARSRAESGTPRGAGVLFDAYEMSHRKQSPKSVNSTMDSRSSLRKDKNKKEGFSLPDHRTSSLQGDRSDLVFFAAAGSRAAIQARFSSCASPLYMYCARVHHLHTPRPFSRAPTARPRRLFPPLGPVASHLNPLRAWWRNCTPYLYFFDVSTCTGETRRRLRRDVPGGVEGEDGVEDAAVDGKRGGDADFSRCTRR